MERFHSGLSINLCIVMVLAAVGSARADDALPSQDQALVRALENHPDIVAAKAKVALAEAELYGKRMEVSRHILALYGSLKMLDAEIEASKAAFQRSSESQESKQAEAQLIQVIGQREQAEKELRLLISMASQAAEATQNRAATAARQTPHGPIVEKMKDVRENPIKLDFVDTPLEEIMFVLSDKTGVMFSIQRGVLESVGFSNSEPISLHTGEVPLHAALQAFEDAYDGFQFVLRDYGVLLTTRDYAQEHGYLPVLEGDKESASTSK
jgi:predicted outer membrane protein